MAQPRTRAPRGKQAVSRGYGVGAAPPPSGAWDATDIDTASTTSASSVVSDRAPSTGIVVAQGYGLHIALERGQLLLSDGVGAQRRTLRLARATCGLTRLVVLGHSGTVSLDALRWLWDLGAAFVHLDHDGNLLTLSGPQTSSDPRLRRAQALAPWLPIGVTLVRDLLREKLRGQANVLMRLASLEGATVSAESIATARMQVDQALEELEAAPTLERLRLVESQAASVYWSAWSALPTRFGCREAARVPNHWLSVGARSSPLTNGPRKAATPAHALLNYLYALLEAEATLAAQRLGLDPSLGLLHADQRYRASLACDLMEAARPQVDAAVLELLLTHTFRPQDLFETREGVVRLLPPLTEQLAQTLPRWAKALAPVAERVAQGLGEVGATLDVSGVTLPWRMDDARAATAPPTASTARTSSSASTARRRATPLTETNRRAGRPKTRATARSGRTRQVTSLQQDPAAPVLPRSCVRCGAVLEDARRQYCGACLPERREEHHPTFSAAGPRALAQRRAAANDPAHGQSAAEKRGKRVSEQRRAITAWREQQASSTSTATLDNRGDVAAPQEADGQIDFTRDLLPRLQDISLAALMQATGLSRRYCWQIRRGEVIPHPRHFPALIRVAQE